MAVNDRRKLAYNTTGLEAPWNRIPHELLIFVPKVYYRVTVSWYNPLFSISPCYLRYAFTFIIPSMPSSSFIFSEIQNAFFLTSPRAATSWLWRRSHRGSPGLIPRSDRIWYVVDAIQSLQVTSSFSYMPNIHARYMLRTCLIIWSLWSCILWEVLEKDFQIPLPFCLNYAFYLQ